MTETLETLLTCTSCIIHFSDESLYKDHYKSEHHRYNVKRKLIGLTPLSNEDYQLQFQQEMSSKSQSQSQIFCEICSKKFMSKNTYKQHINSQRHKENRKNLIKEKNDKSQTSSCSEFQIIGQEKKTECIFCHKKCKLESHLKEEHCFPPFENECINPKKLLQKVEKMIQSGKCIYCHQEFSCQDSAKQHMIDVGHCKLNIDNFGQFEEFYLWRISESSSEQEECQFSQQKSASFELLKGQTLESLQEKRQSRIKYTKIGVQINGKEVGYRHLKAYYKQYLGRQIEKAPRQINQPSLGNGDWKQKYDNKRLDFSRKGQIVCHR